MTHWFLYALATAGFCAIWALCWRAFRRDRERGGCCLRCGAVAGKAPHKDWCRIDPKAGTGGEAAR